METKKMVKLTIPEMIVINDPIMIDYRRHVEEFAGQYEPFNLTDDDFPLSAAKCDVLSVRIHFVTNDIDATTAEIKEALSRDRLNNGNTIETLHLCEKPVVWTEKPVVIAVIGSIIKKRDGLDEGNGHIYCPILFADFHEKSAKIVLDGGKITWNKGTLFPVIERTPPYRKSIIPSHRM